MQILKGSRYEGTQIAKYVCFSHRRGARTTLGPSGKKSIKCGYCGGMAIPPESIGFEPMAPMDKIECPGTEFWLLHVDA
jgi:hypothetical protein